MSAPCSANQLVEGEHHDAGAVRDPPTHHPVVGLEVADGPAAACR
jgi:hypothetical protein